MKPIETVYKGYRFRSRLEARWAVFFDALGISWEYEKEGFDFENGIKYLPDFWLPQVHMFAEVKPDEFTELEQKKCELLFEATGHSILKLIGIPENKPYSAIDGVQEDAYEYLITGEESGPKKIFYEIDYCLTMYHNYPVDEHRFYCQPGDYGTEGDAFWDDTEEASKAAKAARFEFHNCL